MKFVVGKCKKYSTYRVFQVEEKGRDANILGCFASKSKPCDTTCFSTRLISDKPCPICGNTLVVAITPLVPVPKNSVTDVEPALK